MGDEPIGAARKSTKRVRELSQVMKDMNPLKKQRKDLNEEILGQLMKIEDESQRKLEVEGCKVWVKKKPPTPVINRAVVEQAIKSFNRKNPGSVPDEFLTHVDEVALRNAKKKETKLTLGVKVAKVPE